MFWYIWVYYAVACGYSLQLLHFITPVPIQHYNACVSISLGSQIKIETQRDKGVR